MVVFRLPPAEVVEGQSVCGADDGSRVSALHALTRGALLSILVAYTDRTNNVMEEPMSRLTLEQASIIVDAALGKGAEMGFKPLTVVVLDDGGNIMDAASLGSIAALLTAKIPKQRYELGEDTQLPMRDIPISVTGVDLAGGIIFDPTLDEERVANTRLTVISNQDGAISGIQKSGKLVETGGKANVNVILTYVVTVGYFQICITVFSLNAEGCKFFPVGNLTYV